MRAIASEIGFTQQVALRGSTALARWRTGVEAHLADLRSPPRPTAGDLIGGVSVALVLIPQSLAYAGLAGLPPVVGLYASAFPLLFFALFASSPYLQTGPVALTSLLTAGALAGAGIEPSTDAYVKAAALLALIVGVIRLVLGIGRLGAIVYLMSEPVTIGFTSGAAIIILCSQLPKALGVTLPADVSEWANPIGKAAWAVTHPGGWGVSALVISVLALTLMLQGRRMHRLFPGVLVAVVLALLYSRWFDYGGPVVADIEAGLPAWGLDLPWSSTGSLLIGGIVIALVGFAEPASIARHFANEDQSTWSSSREFFASGLANTVAGVTGAYPVGGSFSRSSVNRFAGANTRASGAITGLVVLGFLPVASMLDGLPQAVLGAIVVGAVLNLVKPRRLVRLWSRSPWQASLAYFTLIATLLTPPNLQYAVLLGVALTVALHLVRPFHISAQHAHDGSLSLRARGLLWVATTRRLHDELTRIIETDTGTGPIELSLDRSTAIDSSIAEAVAEGAKAAARADRDFTVTNPPDGAEPILANLHIPVA